MCLIAMPPLKENRICDGSEEDTPQPRKKTSKIRPPARQHIVTKHNYHDHLNDPVVITSNGANNPSFPAKLHEMLQKVEADGYSNVVSWQPHGRCFVVHDPTAFKTILPNYFKLSKLASFQRQLNLYGFQRLTAGMDKNGYYHELFLRGRIDLVARMNRIKVKGTGVRAKANPDEEPNLYVYPAVDPTASEVLATTSSNKRKSSSTSALVSSSPLLAVSLGKTLPSVPQPPSVVSSNESSPLTVPSVALELPSSLLSVPSLNPIRPLATPPSPPDLQSMVILDENEDASILDRLIDAISTATGGEASTINFDRLIDMMFTHGQTVKFGDLVKLSTA